MDSSDENPRTADSNLRFAGLLTFVIGTVVSAQLFAHGISWIFAALAAVVAGAGMIAMAIGLKREALAGRTRLSTGEKALLRYEQFQGLWTVGFVLSFVFAELYAPTLTRPVLQGVVIATPLILLAVLVSEFVRMVVRSDEHQRAQYVAASAIAGGTLLVAATAWSVLASLLGGWPEPPGWSLLPGFAVVYGIALSILKRGGL